MTHGLALKPRAPRARVAREPIRARPIRRCRRRVPGVPRVPSLAAQRCPSLRCLANLVFRNVDAERAARGSFVLAVTSFYCCYCCCQQHQVVISCAPPSALRPRILSLFSRALRGDTGVPGWICATTGRPLLWGCYALGVPQSHWKTFNLCRRAVRFCCSQHGHQQAAIARRGRLEGRSTATDNFQQHAFATKASPPGWWQTKYVWPQPRGQALARSHGYEWPPTWICEPTAASASAASSSSTSAAAPPPHVSSCAASPAGSASCRAQLQAFAAIRPRRRCPRRVRLCAGAATAPGNGAP